MEMMKSAILITISISLLLMTACEKAPETPPVASFTISADIARPGEAILFQSTSAGANTFTWDIGDGNSYNEENPSHIYTETGEYIIHAEQVKF